MSTTTIGVWVQRGQIRPTVVTPNGRYRWRWSEVQHQMAEWAKREDEQRRQREEERQHLLREKQQRDG